jgi:hypothetical protein
VTEGRWKLQRTDLNWAIELPVDITRAASVSPGSVAVLYAEPGSLSLEILPPLSPGLKADVRRTCEEFRDAFEEMRQLGD